MRIALASVRRPIFTIMVVLIVLILGGVSLIRLPIDLMPDITYPTLTVYAEYENASPEEVEELITRPIEEALGSVPGVEEMTSLSVEGRGSVRVTFSWGTDLDAAANDVRDKLDQVMPRLPENVDRPTLRKFDLASFPILILGASSNLDPVQMRRLIDDQVKYRIERVPGVASVDVRGGLEREIHVNLDAGKIKALGLPLDLILRRVEEGNVNLPAGTIERGDMDVTIRTPGQYADLDELRNTVIAMRQGAAVRLGEIAEVADAWLRVTRSVRVDGQPGLRLAVNKQSGKNTVEVATGVLKEIEKINRDLPQIHLIPIIDTSDYIRRSISNVSSSALYGGVLAVLVLMVFLRNIRSTIVIATSIPISIIATFTLMYFCGLTLNLMTLGGLALGVGMLVDNSIVVLENIYRMREGGMAVEAAAVDGTEEVTAAILASTLTTVAVFLPLVFMRGMTGVMFRQLSMVIGFSLMCSLVVALTLVPMLAAKILPPLPTSQPGHETIRRRLFRLTGAMLEGLELGYKRALHFSLNHRAMVVVTMVLLLGGSIALVPLVGVELMPATDEGDVRINVEMAVGTRLGVMEEKFQRIEDTVRQAVPELQSTVTTLGASHWRSSGTHTGEMRIALKPVAQRKRSSEEIANDLRRRLRGMPGMTIRTRAGEGLFILRMGMAGEEKVSVEIRGHDLAVGDELARRLKRIVEDVPGVTDAQISRESGNPEELVLIDRAKAGDMKLTVSVVANALQTALTGTQASNYREGGDEYWIRVQLKDPQKLSLDDILDLTVANAEGEPVVLRNVVNVQPRTGPVQIERKDQERIVYVSASIAGRDLGSILADVRKGLTSLPLPEDFTIDFGGDYEEQQKSFRELLLSCVLALILVYMVMACQYESLRDPFVVMFSVPLAAIGVILILFWTRTTFNVQSFIGCIMLGGIVVNNAILLVDHTNLLRRRDGMALRAAIEEAGRRRLRPILMTSLTTILGLIPLALGVGEGGEAQAPLARAVIGGLTSSTLITLVFVPVMYSLFERKMTKEAGAQESPQIAQTGPMRSKAETAIVILFAAFALGGSLSCASFDAMRGADFIGSATAPAGEGSPPHPAAAGGPAPSARDAAGPPAHEFTGPRVHEFPATASAPAAPLEVSVQEAILLALEDNHALAVERFGPPIRRTFEQQERAAFDPLISAEISTNRVKAVRMSRFVPTGSETSTTDGRAGTVGIGTLLPTGTNVDLEASMDFSDSSVYSDTYASSRLGLSVTQALLRGLSLGANLAALRQARLDVLASQYELRGFAESLIADVEGAYWDCALAQRQVEIYTESLALAEKQLAEARERIGAGRLAETELAAAQAEVALRREGLINARSDLAKGRLRLLRLLNPPGSRPWDRTVLLRDRPAAPQVALDDVEGHVQVALRMRPDLNQSRLAVQRGELELIRTADGLLPKLDLFITLGKTGYANVCRETIRQMDQPTYDVLIGVRGEFPPANRDARAQHQRARLTRDQSAKAVENLAQLVQVDVRGAYIEVLRAREQIAATAATRTLQEEKLRAESEKFGVGKSTSLLVAQAQRDVLAAQIGEIQAVVNYLRALVDLHRLEGSLLERRGIAAPGRDRTPAK